MKMMKKSVLLPVFAALSLVLLSGISVSATTTVMQSEARGAFAQWSDGTYLYVQAGNTESTLPFPPYSLGKIFIMGGGPNIGFILKELTPTELKWNLISCRVSTEIDGHTLVIDWETVPPTTLAHTNMYLDSMHLVQNGAMRWASATLMRDGQTLLENGMGAVSEGIRVEITMP